MKTFRKGNVSARLSLVVAALLVLMIRATSAQAPASQTAPPTTVLKTTTRLVTVEVVAQDHKGQPVAGLTKDDFELLEDGVPQQIKEFSVQGSMVMPAPQAAPGAPGVKPSAMAPTSIAANAPAPPPEMPASSTVILLDGLNTNLMNLAMARGELGKFLREMGPQDRVALYSMGGNLRIMQDFTNNSALLLKALAATMPQKADARLAPQTAGGPPGQFNVQQASTQIIPFAPPMGGLPGQTVQGNGPSSTIMTGSTWDPAEGFNELLRPRVTMAMFAAIAKHLAPMPGRKTLIWITYGFPLVITFQTHNARPDYIDLSPEVRSVSRLLANYHIALYPIDARGLVVGSYDGSTNMPVAMSMSGAVRGMLKARDTSVLFAELTGGRAIYDNNDFADAIQSAIDDSRLTYVLGYYPAPDKWDSKFHTFKVRVRRPGVKLLYRTGYVASDEQVQPENEQEKMIATALASRGDSGAIGFRAQLQKSGTGAAQALTLNLMVDITDLHLNEDHHLWRGGLEVAIGQRGADGNLLSVDSQEHSIALNLEEDYYARLRKQGLSLSFPVTLAPHTAQLKVVLRDATSGALGSVSIPLNTLPRN